MFRITLGISLLMLSLGVIQAATPPTPSSCISVGVSKTVLIYPVTGGKLSQPLLMKGACRFAIASEEDWISVSTANNSISVSVDKNMENHPRKGKVVVVVPGAEKIELDIKQDGLPDGYSILDITED